jgi:hypothetical protein
VHHAIDPKLERGLRGVSHVPGVPKDVGTCRLIVNQHRFARDIELVAPGLRLGKGLKGVPAILQQILSLRGRWDNQHEETVIG